MSGITASMVETANGVHRLRFAGSGEPLMVIPGGPALGATYLVSPLTDLLSTSRRLIFVDQRGSGCSPVGTSPLSIEAFAADMVALLDQLGIERTDIYAHSFGALQTVLFCSEFPERVGRVVLSEAMPPTAELRAAAFGPGTPRYVRTRQTDVDEIAELQQDPNWMFDPAKLKRWAVLDYRWMYPNPSISERIPVEMDGHGYLQFRATDSAVNTALGNDYDLTPQIASIECETLLIYTKDSILGTDTANTYNQLFQRSDLVWLEGGHLPSMEDPEALRSTVTAFLSDRP